MKKIAAILLIISAWVPAIAQVVISSGATLAAGTDTQISVQSPGNLNNGSAFDFSNTILNMNLSGGADQTISGNWTFSSLQLTTTSNKNVSGNITITNSLDLVQGYLVPQSSGKVLFTGPPENLTYPTDGDSYVRGIFYQQGTGERHFPVGTGGTAGFAPLTLMNVGTDNEIGVQAFNTDAQLVIPSAVINSINRSRYWQITTSDYAAINSQVQLGISDLILGTDEAATVLQAEAVGLEAINLHYSSVQAGSSVTSEAVVSAPIVTTGTTVEVDVKIRDLITPFGSLNVNDVLTIENLEGYKYNTVTLLDRWGTVIKRWVNYDAQNPGFDFSKLGPGNYICIVTYGSDIEGNNTKTASQMVTVLKTN